MTQRQWLVATIGAASAVAVVTVGLYEFGVESATTVALAYLMVVLFVASWTHLLLAVGVSLVATLLLNYFFMAPVGTFTIADTHNWIALGAFLVVAVVASNLSSTARARAREAIERRNEVTRLFDLSRDVLLTTRNEPPAVALARHIARRFELSTATIAVPDTHGGWQVTHGGEDTPDLDRAELDRAWAASRGGLEFDAKTRSYGGHRTLALASGTVRVVPVRIGVRPVGIAVLGGRDIEPGTADAIAGLAAIALERSRLLEEQRVAELAHQRADLSSALLASLGHDLRTPLTAIRVATANAGDARLEPEVRHEQAELALSEIDHLARVLQEILDMARIEARALNVTREWVSAAAIVEAAVAHAGSTLSRHDVAVDADEDTQVELDPRLTSAALAHVLENASRYSPAGTVIRVQAAAGDDGLRIVVEDEGPGFADEDLERLFEPFVRGRSGSRAPSGTGLGLAITRGLLAAEGGRAWAENGPHGGRFSIHVPAARRPLGREEAWT